MTIIQRYLAKNIIASITLLTVLFMGLDVFIAFVTETAELGRGDFGPMQAFLYAFFKMPEEIYQFFPMMSLIGTLLSLGTMSTHSELIVMRTAGVSLFEISKTILKVALVLAVVITVIGESVAPRMTHHAETQKAIAISGGQALRTTQGLWMRDGNTYIHIHAVMPGGTLKGISQYVYDDQNRLITESYAEEANYQNGKWHLQAVSSSFLTETTVTSSFTAEKIWKIALEPTLIAVSATEPEQMTITKLYRYVAEKKSKGLAVGDFELSLWQRAIQPLATCIMIFLAIPFIFGPLRSATMGLRLMAGISVGFTFYILNKFFGPVSLVYQLPPLLGALLPTLIIAAAAYGLMRKAS